MNEDIAALRDALAAGPTPGPWAALPEEDGVKYVRIRGTRLGTTYKIANAMLPAYENPPAFALKESRANAALIAACHPERIARLLDALEAAQRRLELLERDANRTQNTVWKATP